MENNPEKRQSADVARVANPFETLPAGVAPASDAPAYLRPGALPPKPGEDARHRPTILRATLDPSKTDPKKD